MGKYTYGHLDWKKKKNRNASKRKMEEKKLYGVEKSIQNWRGKLQNQGYGN